MHETYNQHRVLSHLIIFLSLSVILLTFQLRILDNVVLFFFTPVESALVSLTDHLQASIAHYHILLTLRDEYDRLSLEMAELKHIKLKHVELSHEVVQLHRMLELRQSLSFQTIPARVIGKSPISPNSTLIIDGGAERGIRKFQGVMTNDGVVGRIIGMSASSSKVQMLIDKSCAIAAMNQRTRDQGVIRGLGLRKTSVSMDYIFTRAGFQPGDTIITSGLDGVFPPGLLIGSVIAIEQHPTDLFFQQVLVQPAADCNRVERVLVVVMENSAGPREEHIVQSPGLSETSPVSETSEPRQEERTHEAE